VKFDRQRELVVLWSSGLEKSKILNLFFRISFLVLGIQLLFSVLVTPSTLYQSRDLIKNSNFDSLGSIIKINDFTDSFKKMTFYIERKNKDVLENVFIRDKANNFKNLSGSENENNDTVIIAKKGLIKNKKIFLSQGVIQTLDNEGKIESLYFSKTELNIENLTPRVITAPKLQETSTLSLLSCVFTNNKFLNNTCSFSDNTRENVTETLARRLVLPLYIPSVCLVACFLLCAKRRKSKLSFFKNNFIFLIGFLILVAAEIL
jgi:Predicted permeases